ncbi:FadR/GntR family transcriptional regulator [Pelosinus propionicus]|uniref:FCD domain-containing protein n=1 Tax=Pelosinus propionicus DSM 13327 TaxID=1123291 RepID=A0A1I4M3F2_9FIRM|nr:FadR/GntR family transcriptional regulator [Pelosinus propionicus]SFL97730.1 FCD domain-containing protein [Pelosinus propionicus DSM 13327]
MIEKKYVSQQIFDYLFNEIKDRKLIPGDKLPNERQLSETLGVSRPPLREALKSLSHLGLLTIKHGGGTYVNNYDDEFLSSILQYLMVINEELIYDLIQVRKVLEAEAAKLASLVASDKDLIEMDSILMERERIVSENKVFSNDIRDELNHLDYKFHVCIAKASNNKIVLAFIASIRNALAVHQNKSSVVNNMPELVNEYHRRIFNAIKGKNADLASSSMRDHIQAVENAIRESDETVPSESTGRINPLVSV